MPAILMNPSQTVEELRERIARMHALLCGCESIDECDEAQERIRRFETSKTPPVRVAAS